MKHNQSGFALKFIQQLSPPTLIWKCIYSQAVSPHDIHRPTSKLVWVFFMNPSTTPCFPKCKTIRLFYPFFQIFYSSIGKKKGVMCFLGQTTIIHSLLKGCSSQLTKDALSTKPSGLRSWIQDSPHVVCVTLQFLLLTLLHH